MLRLQHPLARAVHRRRPPTSSHERIAAAKATLGDRLFILGHHYQRDEVIRWADARGDTYRLSVLAQEQPEAEYIVFCGVHFMAESADVLTGRPPAGDPPRPQRRLLDGRHGRHRRGGGGLGGARPRSSTSTGSCRSPT